MRFIFFIIFFIPQLLLCESSVWKVSKGDETVFIGGTIHILREEDYPLPKEYEKAYSLSDELYFETDLIAINSPEVGQMMMSKMLSNNGKTLSTVLSEHTYSMLEIYSVRYGINLQDLEYFKPAMPILIVTIAEIKNNGFKAQGVDDYYMKKATLDKKMISHLESIEEQIDYITSMGVGNENNFVLQSLKDLEKIKKVLPQTVKAWKNGDEEILSQLFVTDLKRDYPKLYENLLVERNNNWIPLIKKMFNDSDTEFVLVGTAHLVGEDGVLSILENDGYKVEKLK